VTRKGVSARLAGPASAIGEKLWDALANPARESQHPFTRYAFFAALEESGSACAETGWQPVHLILERDEHAIGLLPLYLKSHSLGEYVFDHGWAEAFARAGGNYYPKLQASVPFTPVTGRRLFVARGEDQAAARQMLLNAGEAAVKELNVSSLHITFLTGPEWALAGENGYLQRTDQQFHWHNRGYKSFGDFLGDLASAKRKTIRKERDAVAKAGVTFEWLTGSDLSEAAWDDFFAGYIDTGSRKWGSPYLTREFFSRAGESMGDQILLVVAKRARRTIAGALNFFGGGILYGRNWGATEFVDFLHFEACYYQAIEFAIARGLSRVEAGAQGPHKLARGYLPSPTYSAHYIAHAGLRRAVADYLSHERGAVAEEMKELAAQAPFKKGA
jgi:uncharacterized protein